MTTTHEQISAALDQQSESLDFSPLNTDGESVDWSTLNHPEDNASATWGGRRVKMSAIRKLADESGVSTRAILKLDSTEGRIGDWLAKSAVGDVALRAGSGLEGIIENATAGIGRLTGHPEIAQAVSQQRQDRQEFLKL